MSFWHKLLLQLFSQLASQTQKHTCSTDLPIDEIMVASLAQVRVLFNLRGLHGTVCNFFTPWTHTFDVFDGRLTDPTCLIDDEQGAHDLKCSF